MTAQATISSGFLTSTVIIGIIIIAGFFFGRSVHRFKFPAILGYMLAGVVLGPSCLNIADSTLQQNLDFFVQITLAMVALNIGLELRFKDLLGEGRSIACIIFSESFMAFIMTALAIYLLTRNLALSVVLGCLAPASAPAGTLAVIQEYKSKGKLTRALYAVVGFDDGLAIIIFGFALAFVKLWFAHKGADLSILPMLWIPIRDIGFSIVLGAIFAGIFYLLDNKVTAASDNLVLIMGFILITASISKTLGVSVILTNMIMGIMLCNIPKKDLKCNLEVPMTEIMPFMYIMFFVLAGAHLNVRNLASISLLGFVYILARTMGLISGSWLGGYASQAEPKIRKYLGFGILSQAGVAIGLSLIIKNELTGLGPIVSSIDGVPRYAGDVVGDISIATITVTSIIFGLIGPLSTKFALVKAGEISTGPRSRLRELHKFIALGHEEPVLWGVYQRYGFKIENPAGYAHEKQDD